MQKEKRGGFGANKFARNPAPRVVAPSGDRYAVCAATLACRLGAFRTAPAYGGSLRSADTALSAALSPSRGFGAEPHNAKVEVK